MTIFLPIKFLVMAGLILSLAGCGGYASHNYPPVEGRFDNGSTLLAKADRASFSGATLLYPARISGHNHNVPVGEFLLSRVIEVMPKNGKIEAIRLEHYNATCDSRDVFNPSLWCVSSMRLAINVGGETRIVTASSEREVGARIIPGDIAPPFTMGDMFTTKIHSQARISVYDLTEKLAMNLAGFGQ